MADKKDINIQILGQTYTIKASADENILRSWKSMLKSK